MQPTWVQGFETVPAGQCTSLRQFCLSRVVTITFYSTFVTLWDGAAATALAHLRDRIGLPEMLPLEKEFGPCAELSMCAAGCTGHCCRCSARCVFKNTGKLIQELPACK